MPSMPAELMPSSAADRPARAPLPGPRPHLPPAAPLGADRPGSAGPHAEQCARLGPGRARLPADRASAASARPRPPGSSPAGSTAPAPTAAAADAGALRRCASLRRDRRGPALDVIEMDAASHTGIDDMRELVEGVRYAPTSSRYKVYILDEVHMLSREGLQRPAEDARGAAAARQLHLRHHRSAQGPGHGAVALPAVRAAPGRGRAAGSAPGGICRQGRGADRARRAGADRARRRGLGARCALAARSGDRLRRGAGRRRHRSRRCWAWPTARACSTCSST